MGIYLLNLSRYLTQTSNTYSFIDVNVKMPKSPFTLLISCSNEHDRLLKKYLPFTGNVCLSVSL